MKGNERCQKHCFFYGYLAFFHLSCVLDFLGSNPYDYQCFGLKEGFMIQIMKCRKNVVKILFKLYIKLIHMILPMLDFRGFFI
jgi:hypothetical protein